MKGTLVVRTVLLALIVSLPLAGCQKKKEMSQDQVRYLSHMDQAQFFQKQGELKASTQEARSASKLEPQRAAPYLLIVDNLLIAGDATNATHELKLIEEHLSKGIPATTRNRLALYWARAELLKKDYDAALKHLDKVTTDAKDGEKQQVEADNLRGRVLLEKGDVGGAEKAYQAAEKADPKSVDSKVGLSRIAYRQGDRNRAKQLVADALKLDKENSQAWLWKARMAQQDKDYSAAEKAYMQALDGIGKYDIMTYQKYQTMSSLIQVLRAQNKIQQAYVYEDILAKSRPGTIKSSYEAAARAYGKGNLDAAARHLEEILRLSPGNSRSALLLGLIRFQQGKTEEAQKILKPLEKENSSLEASKLLAATQIQLGQSQQAQQMLKKLKDGNQDPGVLALVGVAAIGTGEPEVGRKYIEKSLSLNPDNVGLRLRFGNWLMQQRDYGAAAEQARLALKSKPDLVQARRLEVAAYMRNHEYRKAAQTIAAWQKQQPKNVAAVLAGGDLQVSQQHPDRALKEYRRAAQMAPDQPGPQIALGNLMMREGDTGKALPHFRKAVELAPNNRTALASLMQASTRDKATLKDTMSFLRRLADDQPGAAGPRVVLMENALREGNFKKSEQLADSIQNLAKDQGGVENFMVAVYSNAVLYDLRRQKPDQATKIVNLAMKRFPDNLQVGLVNAHVLFAQGQENDALDVLRKLKQAHPDSDRPYLVEAQYRDSKKQYDQAVELYKLALEKSDVPAVSLQLARAQSQAGQPKNALKTLEKTASSHPDLPGVLLQLGMAYQNAKDTDKAMSTYERLLKLAPNQPIALNNLAWLYQQKGDKRAVEMARRAYQAQPRSAAIADTYGWILLQQGEAKKSVPILEKAHKLAPDEKDIALHLVDAYRKTSQDEKAKAILQKF